MNEATAWHEKGRAHLAADRAQEAFACLARAARLAPSDPKVAADLAKSLFLSGRAEEAVPIYRALVSRAADDPPLLVDLGRALRATGAFPDALAIYEQALARLPREPAILNNIGNCLLAMGQVDAAIASFRRAIQERPNYAEAHHNLGLALLTSGRMKEGWQAYRWRLHTASHLVNGKPLAEWDGVPMPGKVLLVRAEQGLGDTIQFARYLPIAARRAIVVAIVQPALRRLLIGLPGVAHVLTEGDAMPVFDAECALMSLPRLLSLPEPEDAGAVPYLQPDPVAVDRWRARVENLPGPKIGLVWAGSPGLGTTVLLDRRRSLPLSAFASLTGATFVSLQKGPAAIQARMPPAGMTLIDWTGELHDFSDTAALIAGLDMVVTVDTSVAHLAGALDKPVFMLNRFDTDWRWAFSGDTSPWYPSMRIFRQTSPGDWTAPMAALATALHQPPAARHLLVRARASLAAGRAAQAEDDARRAIAAEPDNPEAHETLGLCLLLGNRWNAAWPEWSWRHRQTAPHWNGEAMENQTLLLHADNVEDVMLYGRYVPEAARRSRARIVLAVPPELQRLMAGSPHAAIATTARPAHHQHCKLALLPSLFRARPGTVPDQDLCPQPPLPVIESWSPKVTRLRGLRVGVAFDDPGLLTALTRLPGVDIIRLGQATADGVHDWTAGFDDLTAVAGLLAHLDLIVADGNAIAHLAAALGRPVWVFLSAAPRWPWLPGREDNVWYPTVRQIPCGTEMSILAELAAMTEGAPEDGTFAFANDRYRRADYRAAATGFRQTLAIQPHHAGALGNLSITMLILGRPDIAVRYAAQAVKTAPASHPLRLRLGLALHAAGHFDDATARLREALSMAPDHADTITALGNALGAAGDIDAAIRLHRAAIGVRPDGAGYHVNLAYTLLRAGQWPEAWSEHEYRTGRPAIANPWNGEPLNGRPLLLRHEQGLGDVIQFCRYAPLAAERAGGPVFLTVPGSLRTLLATLPGVSILTVNDKMPANAVQYPLMSLPLLFGTRPETIPAATAYLRADPARVAHWRDRVSPLPGPRIGLVWAGNPRLGTASLGATDRRRSLPEGALTPLSRIETASFVSLQVGDAPLPGVAFHDWTQDLTSFAETAALIEALDLVISVDTSVAHLAGALGKPVWLLNRFDTDWRWGDGETSAWYPSMRIFRQTTPGDWAGVVERIANALQDSMTRNRIVAGPR